MSAVSGRDAWAAGFYYPTNGTPGQPTLILHWNGTAWTRMQHRLD